jgi:dTDP-L-rhamnose 4-epimerase
MTTIITGAHGFIGTHVTRALRERGDAVLTCDLLEPRVHGRTPTALPDRMCHAGALPYADLRAADAIIHLAAQVGVADSMDAPERYVRDNTADTVALLTDWSQALRLGAQPKALIVASSMSVYGDPGVYGYVNEAHPVNPASVYGLTKYDQERLALLWGAHNGVRVVALRFFNVYGLGQALTNPYTGVLANFANWLLRGERPRVYEDGQQTRDFIAVEDVACAVVAALDSEATGVYNICTGVPTTILGAAEALSHHLTNGMVTPQVLGVVRSGDIRHCIGDPRAAARDLGFAAQVPFSVGIERYARGLLAAR